MKINFENFNIGDIAIFENNYISKVKNVTEDAINFAGLFYLDKNLVTHLKNWKLTGLIKKEDVLANIDSGKLKIKQSLVLAKR